MQPVTHAIVLQFYDKTGSKDFIQQKDGRFSQSNTTVDMFRVSLLSVTRNEVSCFTPYDES